MLQSGLSQNGVYDNAQMNTGVRATIDWSGIDTVLLDMDGTLLDLGFDNFFWREYVPRHYGRARGIAIEEARRRLESLYRERQGSLQWYCLDFWTRELDLDILRLKREVRERVRYIPRVPEFLQNVRALDKRLILVTNAHRDSLLVKIEQTALHRHFDAVYSSHDFGVPKEDAHFWSQLAERESFDPARSLLADDSLPVLRAARDYGIAHLIAIRRPDLGAPRREIDEFPAVDGLGEMDPSANG